MQSISSTFTCPVCGGYRLLPCPSCKGSKKSVHRNHFTTEFVALKCMNCDEVGLVKCYNCWIKILGKIAGVDKSHCDRVIAINFEDTFVNNFLYYLCFWWPFMCECMIDVIDSNNLMACRKALSTGIWIFWQIILTKKKKCEIRSCTHSWIIVNVRLQYDKNFVFFLRTICSFFCTNAH